jgi:8-oxo-dGTP pyrophosphatase MutT (NUDIX family)
MKNQEYTFKPYRQAVMAIIIKEDDSFLIGSSPRDGGYKFPQGGLEEGEDKKVGLFREILEELGTVFTADDEIIQLSASSKYPYPSHKPYSKRYSGQELHVFIVKYKESMSFMPQDNEFDQLHWITEAEMDQFNFEHRKQAYYEAVSNAFTYLNQP